MDVHQPTPSNQQPLPPAWLRPPAQSARRSRTGWLPMPKSVSGKILLGVIIAVVALQLAMLLLTVFFAAVSGYPLTGSLLQDELGRQLLPLLGWLALLLVLLGSAFLSILIHEGGHLLACWSVGFWLYQCKLGPFLITRARRGFRLQVSRSDLWLGYVVACPLDDRRLRLRKAILVAGGPLASLAMLVVFWWLYALNSASACAGLSFLACFGNGLMNGIYAEGMSAGLLMTTWLAWTLLLALFIFWGTLFPYTSRRGIYSDGLKLLWCFQGSPQITRDLLLARLVGQTARGVRPRAWPAGLAEQLMTLLKQFPTDRSLLVYAYYLALENRQIQAAGTFLDRAVLTLEGATTVEATLALETAYFEARYRGNLAAARAWLGQATPGASRFEDLMRPRAEAAISLLEGRAVEALSIIGAGLAALARIKETSLHDLEMEEEDLQGMLTEARWQQAASPGEDAGVSARLPLREYGG
jgi:hypothetical protein